MANREWWRQSLDLVLIVGACELAGVLSSLTAQTGGSPWYQELYKPWFTPPPWVFAVVWTILYGLMGVAAFLVWRCGFDRRDVRWALLWFIGQLLTNLIWTPIFFGMRWIVGGLVVISIMWWMIAATILAFRPISRVAAAMLVPYWAWVSFAAILNGTIMTMNE